MYSDQVAKRRQPGERPVSAPSLARGLQPADQQVAHEPRGHERQQDRQVAERGLRARHQDAHRVQDGHAAERQAPATRQQQYGGERDDVADDHAGGQSVGALVVHVGEGP